MKLGASCRFGALSHPRSATTDTPEKPVNRLRVVDAVHAHGIDGSWRTTTKKGKIPLRRQIGPAEAAAHVAWLASGENGYVTGQVLGADGELCLTF